MAKSTILWAFLGLALPALACALDSAAPLDQDAVRRHYGDGDFDPAISLLEDFQKTHARFTREESLMVYKYLGVMYCADGLTREKGKTYFYKLLQVDPQAKILDMYVSILVQEVFRTTLDELMGQQSLKPSDRSPDAGARDTKDAGRASNPKQTESRATLKSGGRAGPAWYWWAGGAGLAAGVAGGYYLYAQSSHEKSPDTDISIKP